MKWTLIIVLVLLTSCTVEPRRTFNPHDTTIQMLSYPRDSVEIVIIDNALYVYRDGAFVMRALPANNNYTLITKMGLAIILAFGMFFMIIFFYERRCG